MIASAYISPITKPDFIVGMLGIVGLLVVGGWFLVRRFLNSPKPAEPWGIEVTEALESGEATPLCHRCLSPHGELVNFCPVCGATVGQYTNLLPYLYIFSIGDLLRVGTGAPFRRSPFMVFGFLLAGFAEYTLFAPVYWFVLLRNLRGKPAETKPRAMSDEA